jgi:predicted nucleotidyltransferase
MRGSPGTFSAQTGSCGLRRGIARRVADAHAALCDSGLLALVSGSTVDGTADEQSDVDMSVVLARLPETEAPLLAACTAAGASEWFWRVGTLAEGGLMAAMRIDRIEVQIGYTSHERLARDIDELLVRHNPDTPLHKLGEGLLKAEALAGVPLLDTLKARLAVFPPELGRAMVAHFLSTPTPWRAIAQIVHRDTLLWCRDLQVDAVYRLLGVLAGLNGCYYTRFQVKRLHKLANGFALAPAQLAERIDAMLTGPVHAGFELLHALEGDVLALVKQHLPGVDVAAALERRKAWPGS